MDVFAELKRRRVFQATAAYLVSAWVLLQVVDLVGPAIGLPGQTLSILIAFAALGLPVTIAVSWVYDLKWKSRAVTLTRETPGTRDEAQRLVVLPFRLLNPDPEISYLAFALADAVSCSLAGVPGLVLRSTMSVTARPEDADLRTLARELDVDAALTGTLLRVGNQLQFRAQLAQLPDGTMLWSHGGTIQLSELFSLQDELARRIVEALALPGAKASFIQAAQDKPATPRAFELYLRANQLSIQAGQWQDAIALYEECLREDPNFAPAWARLGRCHRLLAKWEMDGAKSQELRQRAGADLERSLALNPDLALAHSLYAQLDLDVGRPEHALIRLLARTSVAEHVDLYAGLVQACRFCGLLAESKAAYERAHVIDPNTRTSVAHTYFMQGDYEAALAEYNNADIGYLEALALAMLGRNDEAILLLRKREADKKGSVLEFYLGSLRALLEGDLAAAAAASDAAVQTGMGGDGEAIYYMTRQYARMGETRRALETFDQVVDLGFYCYPAFALDPWLDSIRDAAAFKVTLRRAELRHKQSRSAFLDAGGARLLGAPALTA